ncbi:FecR domain-containing protein [Sphingobacterium detergens]|uniref:FecR family protein n=1 Tax=Sphingobacterium detergens TaxID=1145106 RepID=A0A420B7X9_SPHD1|nr:FecR domain-containing protein [Sphingobacterium detergens]RKE52896.1 FecR family protein [Sphingobacterium detergens]
MNKELLERYIVGETNEAENNLVQRWLEEDPDNRAEYLKVKNVFLSYLYAMNKELLERHMVGETNEAERMIVEEWLEKDANNREAYLQMKKLWDSLPKPLVVPEVDVDKAWIDFKIVRDRRASEPAEIPKRKTNLIQWNWWAAASILLVCMVGFYVFDRSQRKEMHLASQEAVLQDSLPDGSMVTLNKNTELAYSSSWSNKNRNVELKKGEVFFQVQKDKKHPFVIATGNTNITVLGTSFNVRRIPNATEVIVATGLVKVAYADKEIFLRPDQMLTIRDADTMKVEKKPVQDKFYKYYVDREFNFENTPLKRVAEVLSHAYDYKVMIDDPALEKIPYTAEFKQNSLAEILKVMAKSLDLKIEVRDKEIHLTSNKKQ